MPWIYDNANSFDDVDVFGIGVNTDNGGWEYTNGLRTGAWYRDGGPFLPTNQWVHLTLDLWSDGGSGYGTVDYLFIWVNDHDYGNDLIGDAKIYIDDIIISNEIGEMDCTSGSCVYPYKVPFLNGTYYVNATVDGSETITTSFNTTDQTSKEIDITSFNSNTDNYYPGEFINFTFNLDDTEGNNLDGFGLSDYDHQVNYYDSMLQIRREVLGINASGYTKARLYTEFKKGFYYWNGFLPNTTVNITVYGKDGKSPMPSAISIEGGKHDQYYGDMDYTLTGTSCIGDSCIWKWSSYVLTKFRRYYDYTNNYNYLEFTLPPGYSLADITFSIDYIYVDQMGHYNNYVYIGDYSMHETDIDGQTAKYPHQTACTHSDESDNNYCVVGYWETGDEFTGLGKLPIYLSMLPHKGLVFLNFSNPNITEAEGFTGISVSDFKQGTLNIGNYNLDKKWLTLTNESFDVQVCAQKWGYAKDNIVCSNWINLSLKTGNISVSGVNADTSLYYPGDNIEYSFSLDDSGTPLSGFKTADENPSPCLSSNQNCNSDIGIYYYDSQLAIRRELTDINLSGYKKARIYTDFKKGYYYHCGMESGTLINISIYGKDGKSPLPTAIKVSTNGSQETLRGPNRISTSLVNDSGIWKWTSEVTADLHSTYGWERVFNFVEFEIPPEYSLADIVFSIDYIDIRQKSYYHSDVYIAGYRSEEEDWNPSPYSCASDYRCDSGLWKKGDLFKTYDGSILGRFPIYMTLVPGSGLYYFNTYSSNIQTDISGNLISESSGLYTVDYTWKDYVNDSFIGQICAEKFGYSNNSIICAGNQPLNLKTQKNIAAFSFNTNKDTYFPGETVKYTFDLDDEVGADLSNFKILDERSPEKIHGVDREIVSITTSGYITARIIPDVNLDKLIVYGKDGLSPVPSEIIITSKAYSGTTPKSLTDELGIWTWQSPGVGDYLEFTIPPDYSPTDIVFKAEYSPEAYGYIGDTIEYLTLTPGSGLVYPKITSPNITEEISGDLSEKSGSYSINHRWSDYINDSFVAKICANKWMYSDNDIVCSNNNISFNLEASPVEPYFVASSSSCVGGTPIYFNLTALDNQNNLITGLYGSQWADTDRDPKDWYYRDSQIEIRRKILPGEAGHMKARIIVEYDKAAYSDSTIYAGSNVSITIYGKNISSKLPSDITITQAGGSAGIDSSLTSTSCESGSCIWKWSCWLTNDMTATDDSRLKYVELDLPSGFSTTDIVFSVDSILYKYRDYSGTTDRVIIGDEVITTKTRRKYTGTGAQADVGWTTGDEFGNLGRFPIYMTLSPSKGGKIAPLFTDSPLHIMNSKKNRYEINITPSNCYSDIEIGIDKWFVEPMTKKIKGALNLTIKNSTSTLINSNIKAYDKSKTVLESSSPINYSYITTHSDLAIDLDIHEGNVLVDIYNLTLPQDTTRTAQVLKNTEFTKPSALQESTSLFALNISNFTTAKIKLPIADLSSVNSICRCPSWNQTDLSCQKWICGPITDYSSSIPSWKYRIEMNISGIPANAFYKKVEAKMEFTQLLQNSGCTVYENCTFDENSLRVVEKNSSGNCTYDYGCEVQHQFEKAKDYNPNTNADGKVKWIMQGLTPANTVREYYIYFDIIENGAKQLIDYFNDPDLPKEDRYHAQTDLDQDGKIEIVVSDLHGYVYIIDGDNPSNVEFTSTDLGDYVSLAIGNFDGDSIPDLAAIDNYNSLKVLEYNTQTETYDMRTTGNCHYGGASGDVDGDGLDEIICPMYGWYCHCARVYGWDGNNYVLEDTIYTQEKYPIAAAVGDIDQDGVNEIIVQGWTNGEFLEIFGWDGNSYVSEWFFGPTDELPNGQGIGGYSLGIADTDNNGLLELWTGDESGVITVFEYDGEGDYELKWQSQDYGGQSGGFSFADWDNDGNIEIAYATGTYYVRVFQWNSNTNTYVQEWINDYVYKYRYGNYPTFGDIDQDGIIELFRGSYEGYMSFYHSNSTAAYREERYGTYHLNYRHGPTMLISGEDNAWSPELKTIANQEGICAGGSCVLDPEYKPYLIFNITEFSAHTAGSLT